MYSFARSFVKEVEKWKHSAVLYSRPIQWDGSGEKRHPFLEMMCLVSTD